MIHTNFLAVLVAAVVATVVGMLWYGPLFGESWSKLIGMTPEKMAAVKKQGMTGKYVANFIAALIMAYVLAQSIYARPFLGFLGGFVLSFWIWLGFIATVALGMVLWEGKPMKLYWINTLYYLVSLCLMSAVLVAWR
jgi:hypothetical protein